MSSIETFSRRRFALHFAALPAGIGLAARVLAAPTEMAAAATADGLSHASEAIHQELSFAAAPRKLYDALTVARQFDAVTRLSDGLELLNAPGAKPTAISPRVGGSFTLFGGYVTGRHLQMLPGMRLVQAWRAESWNPGAFSIADFSLAEQGAGTRLTFEHRGFPQGQGAHLASGWQEHYWAPLAKYLA